MKSSKTDFYNALKSAVMFSPDTGDRCGRINTFRVLEQMGGGKLTSENFGATACDKDKPFFWSRAWHMKKYAGAPVWEFPALVLIERSYAIDQPFNDVHNRSYFFNISVVDKYTPANQDKTKCAGCDGRTINEIYEQTEALLFQALNFIGECIEARLPDGQNVLLPKDLLNALKAAKQIEAWDQGTFLGALMKEKIKGVSAYKTAIYQENIFGNSIDLNIPFQSCVSPSFDFSNASDYPVLVPGAGCQTCS